MNSLAPILKAAEERASRPLFTGRRPNECAWPLWDRQVPLDEKRCCGAPVHPGSKVPYCLDHMDAQTGSGTSSERSAVRNLRQLTKYGA